MTRKIRGDRHLGHLPRGVMLDVEESFETNSNKNPIILNITLINIEMDGPRKGLKDGPWQNGRSVASNWQALHAIMAP